MADVWLNPIDLSALAKRVRRMIALFHPLATKTGQDDIDINGNVCYLEMNGLQTSCHHFF